MVKSVPNNDWITTMGDESYVKPVWCGRDYIAKVGGREREREREKERSVPITKLMSAQFGLVSAV